MKKQRNTLTERMFKFLIPAMIVLIALFGFDALLSFMVLGLSKRFMPGALDWKDSFYISHVFFVFLLMCKAFLALINKNTKLASINEATHIAINTSGSEKTDLLLSDIRNRLATFDRTTTTPDMKGFITWKDFITSCVPIILAILFGFLAFAK